MDGGVAVVAQVALIDLPDDRLGLLLAHKLKQGVVLASTRSSFSLDDGEPT